MTARLASGPRLSTDQMLSSPRSAPCAEPLIYVPLLVSAQKQIADHNESLFAR